MSGLAPKRQKTSKVSGNSTLSAWLGQKSSISMEPCPSSQSAVTPTKKRQSGIDPAWKKEFPWLKVTDDHTGMLCRICIKFNMRPRNGGSIWITTPCTALLKESLGKHSKTKMHQEASEREASYNLADQGKGIAAALNQLCSMEKNALVGAMRCIYWLAKEEIPHTTHFASLLELAKSLGCDYLNLLKKGETVHYTSQRTMQDMLDCISLQINQPIIQEITDSTYYTLLIDETTDIAVTKQMSIMARYFTSEMQVKTSFLGLVDLPDGKADTIVASLRKFITEKEIPANKLIGLGSDGANVMVGKKSGVATQLKSTNPEMVNVHCIAHRLALAAAQATDDIPYLKKFKAIMHQIFKFYQNSAVRMAGLKEIESVLGGPIIKMKNIADTRWLSHENAVSAVRQCLPALIVSLEREASERMDATAAGLATFVKNPMFVCSIAMLSDVLPHLNRLSKIFQKTSIDFTLVDPMVSATQMALHNLLANHGSHMRNLPDEFVKLEEHGVRIKESTLADFNDTIYRAYISNIIDNLHDRFPDNKVLDAFSVFDPELLNTEDIHDQDLEKIQLQKIQTLSSHFSSVASFDVGKEEFFGLRYLMAKEMRNISLRESMVRICKIKDLYPTMARYCEIGLIIHVSTADCERTFSCMKRVKSILRNRLSQRILNDLMTISIEGQTVNEFDFDKCASRYGQLKKRKICTE